MRLSLHTLGTAGYHPNEYRQTTCLMIPELGVIFDAGSAFYRVRKLLPLVPAGLILQALISHGHVDHTIGLTYGINVFWGTGRKLEVIGDERHLRTIREKLFDFGNFPLPPDHPLLGYAFRTAAGVPFRTISLPHPGGSTGYRLSLPNGRDLVYITDACADDVPTEFAAGAHTLIHECNFTDNLAELAKNSGHSTTSQVFNLAKRAGVKRLVCMHWNTMLELEAGRFIQDMTGRDPNEPLPFELVLADDSTVIDL